MIPAAQTPLAVIGMGCRLPGADGLEAYWRLVFEGRAAIGELPPERLDQDLYYDRRQGIRGKTYCRSGGVCNYRTSDPGCPLSDQERQRADLAHITGCEVAADACRHAGWDPWHVPTRNVGVYIGHTRGSELGGDLIYTALVDQTSSWLREVPEFASLDGADAIRRALVEQIHDRLPRRQAGGVPDTSSHLAAAIIARALRLSGPAVVMNAACSSSLLALAIARRALEQGRIDAAIVGGTTYCKWDNLVLYSQARSCTAGGSRPFDAEADGLIASDGYALLIVKTLDRAIADGDNIQAVIRGIGISSDGRGKSLWAPRKEGQILAIERAYAGGLDASRLQYVEAHATSTQVGDATEMNALAESIAAHIPSGTRIPIGSAKANIGHTLEAAGAASLIKTILAMQHGVIPGQIHCDRLNPDIDWQNAPFYVPRENTTWSATTDGHPRRAAVNAFGIGGLNAHVVLDEYVPAPARPRGSEHRSQPTTENPEQALPAAIHAPSKPEPIAIVGASCRFAGAASLAAFWNLVASGQDGTRPVPRDRWPSEALQSLVDQPLPAELRGGFIIDFEYDWRRHKVPPVQVARANPLQFLVLDAVDEALRDGGWDLAACDRRQVGVVVGTQFASDFANDLQMGMRLPEFQRDLAAALASRGVPAERIDRIVARYADVLLKHMPALLDESGSFSTSTLASRVAKTYDLMGGAVAIDAGEAAALAAISFAIDDLREGHTDRMICAAAQRMMDPVAYQQLALSGRLPGIVPGEGVGVLLLKRLSDARRDGDRIRGILHEVGAGLNEQPTEATRIAARQARALAYGGGQALAALEFAESGRADQDAALVATLAKELGTHQESMSSLTRRIGHTLGASGMASVLKLLLAFEHDDRSGQSAAVHSVDRWGGAQTLIVENPHAAPRAGRGEEGKPQDVAQVAAVGPPILMLAGTPYEMGLAHGRAHADDIRRVVHAYADTLGQPWDRLPDIDEAASRSDVYFGPEELEEMSGIAAGAGLTTESIIAHNLRLYPDMGSGCVHFLAPGDVDGGLLHAANEDRPAGLMVRGCLVRTIQHRQPKGGIPYVAFGVAGEVGGINGVNASGLAVTSAMLLDLPRREQTRHGLLHVVLVNRLLRQSAYLEDALKTLHAHRGTSAWGLILSHRPTGKAAYAEYDGATVRTQPIEAHFTAANHARLLPPVTETPAHSRHRLARLAQLVERPDLALVDAQAALRDRFDPARDRETRHPTMNTVRRVDNQISLVMQPALGKAWITAGPLAEREDEYRELDLAALLASEAAARPSPQRPTLRTQSDGGRKRSQKACERFVLRVAPADRTPCPARPIVGTALIVGTNALNAALAEQIRARGGRAVLLDANQPLETLLAEIDRLTAGTDPVHLFLTTPHDAGATAAVDSERWQSRRQHGVVRPYLVCQRWYSRLIEGNRLSQSMLIAATALGGEFGFARHEQGAESGALCGLVKAVWFETGMNGPGLGAKVIDLDRAEPPELRAGYVLEEIDRGQPDVEVGYARGRRYVVRPQRADVPPPTNAPEPGGVWVVSGGARGVTAIVARELGRRFGLKLHLLGTSPVPNIDPVWRDLPPEGLRELKAQITRQALAEKKVPAAAWQQIERALEIDRNLQAMTAAGVTGTYHTCNVADREALARTLAAIRAAAGPIQGIVHGAGVEQSCRFEKKQPAMLERTLAAKVDGAANLIDLSRGDPLRYFLAFGSISGRFGNFGQADYSLANEMLAKLVTWLRTTRPEVRATTFEWHSWAEVGMAVRPESKHAKSKKNMQFMPPLEGAAHLIDELCAGLPESEVLITDVDYFRSFYP